MAETPENGRGVHIIDAIPPREMALACEAAGAAKAGRDALALLVPGVLAGAFIALGAIFMTVVLNLIGRPCHRRLASTVDRLRAHRGTNTRSPITKRYNFYPSSTEGVNGCDGRVVDCA